MKDCLSSGKPIAVVNFNLTTCCICQRLMSFQQVREGVYWLPDMDNIELMWARYEGFVHNYAHKACWKRLSEKKRDLYRLLSFEDQVPRSMGQKI